MKEIRAQHAFFVERSGRPPTHVDGHQHVHVIPQFVDCIAQTLSELGVCKVRMMLEHAALEKYTTGASDQRETFRQTVVKQAFAAKDTFSKYGISYPSGFIGSLLMQPSFSSDKIARNIQDMLDKGCDTIELMTHAGFPQEASTDRHSDEFSRSQDRQTEIDVLTSVQFAQTLEKMEVELISFADLPTPSEAPAAKRPRPARRSLLLLSPMGHGKGNRTTCLRLQSIFTSLGYQVHMISSDETDPASLQSSITEIDPDAIFAIHAIRSGGIIPPGLEIPRIIMLSGTDISKGLLHADTRKQVFQVLEDATAIVALSPHQRDAVRQFESKIHVIQQSVDTTIPHTPGPLMATLQSIPSQDFVAMLAAGIRPVKDIGFAFPCFKDQAGPVRLHFVVAGGVLDQAYASELRAQAKDVDTIHFTGLVEHGDVAAALTYLASDKGPAGCVLNTSISEGMSAYILEGMAAGLPVIVRANAGNTNVVRNGENGLVFSTLSELRKYLRTISTDASVLQKLSKAGRAEIAAKFSKTVEANCYAKLFGTVLESSSCTT